MCAEVFMHVSGLSISLATTQIKKAELFHMLHMLFTYFRLQHTSRMQYIAVRLRHPAKTWGFTQIPKKLQALLS
jgi:hypothetical protein